MLFVGKRKSISIFAYDKILTKKKYQFCNSQDFDYYNIKMNSIYYFKYFKV